MSWFAISSERQIRRSGKLMSYKATNKAAALVVTLTVEITDPFEVGHVLSSLEEIRQAHNPPATKRPRKKEAVKPDPLGLPAPRRTLPEPEGRE